MAVKKTFGRKRSIWRKRFKHVFNMLFTSNPVVDRQPGFQVCRGAHVTSDFVLDNRFVGSTKVDSRSVLVGHLALSLIV